MEKQFSDELLFLDQAVYIYLKNSNMKYWCMFFVFISITICLIAAVKEPTIPLNQKIKINILSIDSQLLDKYFIYSFEYQKKRKTIKAEFWAKQEDTIFNLGTTNIILCRIHQMSLDNGMILRGCSFYNGLVIGDDSTTLKRFYFDVFSKYPTLQLCEVPVN